MTNKGCIALLRIGSRRRRGDRSRTASQMAESQCDRSSNHPVLWQTAIKSCNAVSTGRVSNVRRRAIRAIPLRTAIMGPNVLEKEIGGGRVRKSGFFRTELVHARSGRFFSPVWPSRGTTTGRSAEHDKAHALCNRFTTVVILTEQVRAAGDPTLRRLLTRVRKGT